MVRKAFRFVAFALAGLVVFVTIAMFIAVPFAMRGMAEVAGQTITPLDMSTVADGVHEGTYCSGRWCFTVRVRVAHGRIDSLWTVQRRTAGWAAFNQQVFRRIIERQNVFPDAVSGASITTRALMKAVENALDSQPVELSPG
jgi:uncharacterized protein with FMN-binding domain